MQWTSVHPGRAAWCSPVALVGLLLVAGCPAGPGGGTDEPGDTGSGSTVGPTDPGAPTSSATTASATTGEATTGEATVCGDGVVEGGEDCDDGDDDALDGCGADCKFSGEWTYTLNGPGDVSDGARGVAIDGAGRIIVVGYTGGEDMLLMAFAPEGAVLWQRTFGDPDKPGRLDCVAVDASGNIYVGGGEAATPGADTTIVRSFDPDGVDRWTYSDPPALEDYAGVVDLAVTADAVYSLAVEGLLDEGSQFVVRRHDLATGEAAWRTPSHEGAMFLSVGGLAVVGDEIVVAGEARELDSPFVAVFTGAGAHVSTTVDAGVVGGWEDVAPVGPDGDLLLVGRIEDATLDDDIAVRRVGPGFAEQWTRAVDHAQRRDVATAVAVGPDEGFIVVGRALVDVADLGEDGILFDNALWGGRFAADGTLLWTDVEDPPGVELDAQGEAAGFDGGFVVLAGRTDVEGEGYNLWVRRRKAG